MLITAISFGQRRYKNITEKDGNIGIGTKSPDALLTVKGQIHAQEVQVDMEGALIPDYVFTSYFEGASEENPLYILLTLEEVAAFISENHHLPEIPSAEEIEKEGLLLKKMNMLLLQKIEELTLYTLEQQDQINALKEAVNKLQK